MAKLRFGPARVPSHDSPKKAISLLQKRGFSACEIDFEGGFWMDYPWAERFGELARGGEDRALRARADRGLHGPRRARQEATDGRGHARPLGRDREDGRGRASRLPPRVPARPRARGGDRLRLRAARRAARATRGQGPRGAVRRRGDGPRARSRQPRRRDRDLGPARLGSPRARLRAHARDERRRLHGRRAVRGGARSGGRRARAEGAVPHPLQRHPVREQERDEAPPLRRGHAAGRPAAQGAEALQASGDGDLGIARPQVRSGRARGALSARRT